MIKKEITLKKINCLKHESQYQMIKIELLILEISNLNSKTNLFKRTK